MKSVLLKYPVFTIPVVLSILGCGGADVTSPNEPTNEDAIYNIIRYDKVPDFNLNVYDYSVPDTTVFLARQIVPLFYWYEPSTDSLFIGIEIDYPQQGDTAGSVPVAAVRYGKRFWGTVEIIGVDTSNGGSVPVRLSKEYIIDGLILARFEKWGFNYNFRRGWLLKGISDAFLNGAYLTPDRSIHIRSESYPDYYTGAGVMEYSDILTFSPGESLTVEVTAQNPQDYVRLTYPAADGRHTLFAQVDTTLSCVFGFRLPRQTGRDHFLVDLIKSQSLTDTSGFESSGQGLLYRIR